MEAEMQMNPLENESQTSQRAEKSLNKILEEIKPRSANYCALHFQCSKLMEYNRQKKQIETLVSEANKIFAGLNGIVYKLINDDILCIIENKSVIMVERAISQFKRLFLNDPLITNNNKREVFMINYDLGFQWRDFCIKISEIQDNPMYSGGKSGTLHGESSPIIIDGIKLETLNMIENVLKKSDASNYIRRQSIHWYDGKGNPNLHSQHFYFSLPDLQTNLKISESLSGNTWLFRQITIYLDRQMIRVLPTIIQQKCNGSLHVNLNLRSLVTSYFQEFIHNYKNYGKDKTLTLCFDLVDIIAHTDALSYGLNLLKDQGIKTCINNINPLQMELLNLEKIPVDFYKINNSDLFQNRIEDVKRIISANDPKKFILHRADDEKTIRSGISAGISYFQGRGMDKLRSKIIKENEA